MSRVACTIISNNYLAFARVLASSLADHHSEVPLVTLFVDRPSPSIDYDHQPFECLFPDDLKLEGFPGMAFRYSILELNTAVKPRLLEHLLDRGASKVVYFDPDILITAPLDPVWEALERASLVLTPHAVAPLPDDERIPNERAFLLSGIYNLGFAGVSDRAEVQPFLRWWQERLSTKCLHSVSEGLFVDQKWMDFAPAYLEGARILRDVGLNVAYWNLSNRELRQESRVWKVGDTPLRFFHFSGLNPAELEPISKHQNRHRLSDQPQIRPLFEGYARRLREEGHGRWKDLPYGFGSFDDGRPIPGFARVSYRLEDPRGERWPDPFSTGLDSFRGWLEEIVDPHTQRPRLADEIRRGRADLIRVFPDVPGASEEGFAGWLVERCPEEYELALEWMSLLEGYRSAIARRSEAVEVVEREKPAPESIANNLPLCATAVAAKSSEGDGFLPVFLLRLHSMREDLQHAFPDPAARDRHRFLYWWVAEGSLERPVPAPVLRSVAALLPLYSRAGAYLRRLVNVAQTRSGDKR